MWPQPGFLKCQFLDCCSFQLPGTLRCCAGDEGADPPPAALATGRTVGCCSRTTPDNKALKLPVEKALVRRGRCVCLEVVKQVGLQHCARAVAWRGRCLWRNPS